MKIAVVEDEKSHRALLLSYLKAWSTKQEKQVEISSFDSAESFWFSYEEHRDFDILFLDIQMTGMDGMELAHRVRERDKDIVLVFATGLTDYLEEYSSP